MSKIQQVTQTYRQQLLNHEQQAVATLEHAFQHTLSLIQPQLDKLYAEIKAKVDAGESIPPSWLHEQNRLTNLKALLTRDINEFGHMASLTTLQLQHFAVQLGIQSGTLQLKASVPIGVNYNNFGVPSAKAIQSIVGATQAGSPLADLFSGYGDEAAQNVSDTLTSGLIQGNNPNAVAKSVQVALNVPLWRAKVVARSEMLRAYRSASIATMQANSDVCASWVWTCDKSSRTCVACIAMDGTVHDLSEDFGSHPNCRCVPRPQTKSWADILSPLGIDTSDLDDTSPDIQSGSNWFDEQDEATQRQILGNAGYELWKNNDNVTLHSFVQVNHSEDWGDSVSVRPVSKVKK